MKKSMLYTGIAYLMVGLACLALAICFEFPMDGMLWGLGGAGTAPGLVMIWKYFYWTRPEHREEYQERLVRERVELHDERKVMIRDKSGRIASLIMIGVYCILMLVLSFCVVLDRFMPFARYAVIGLGVLLVFQWACTMAAFYWLDKRL